MATPDLDALIEALVEARVEFAIIGGVAAMLHGAPLVTQDLDIVHHRDPENVRALLGVLLRFRAKCRADPRDFPPTEAMLSGRGHILLDTTAGPIDLLCEIGVGQDFAWLPPHTEVFARPSGPVRVVDLPTLIELKVAANRPKDRFAVPILIATLEERERSGRR